MVKLLYILFNVTGTNVIQIITTMIVISLRDEVNMMNANIGDVTEDILDKITNNSVDIVSINTLLAETLSRVIRVKTVKDLVDVLVDLLVLSLLHILFPLVPVPALVEVNTDIRNNKIMTVIGG